jgi:hypothetical protein
MLTPALQRLPDALRAEEATPLPAYQAAPGRLYKLETPQPPPPLLMEPEPFEPLPIPEPSPETPITAEQPIWPWLGGALLVAAGILFVSERIRTRPEEDEVGVL